MINFMMQMRSVLTVYENQAFQLDELVTTHCPRLLPFTLIQFLLPWLISPHLPWRGIVSDCVCTDR